MPDAEKEDLLDSIFKINEVQKAKSVIIDVSYVGKERPKVIK